MVIRIRDGRAVLSLEDSDRVDLPIDLKLQVIACLLAQVLDAIGTKEIELALQAPDDRA